MQRYPVYYRGAPCGEMTVRQEGLYFHFCSQISFRGTEIPRIYLKGGKGELLLGVAEPAGGAYVLRRSLAAGNIEKLGPLHCGEVRVKRESTGRWQALGQEEVRLCQKFCLHLPVMQSGLCRPLGEGREIAFPYSERRAFPMPGLFTLARIERIGGQEYAVFSFAKSGMPFFAKK